MTDQDELAELEAERDRLRTMSDYYERPEIGFPELPLWFRYFLLGAACVIAVWVAVGMLAGEIDPSLVIFSVVFAENQRVRHLDAHLRPLESSRTDRVSHAGSGRTS
jgi:hypothetical protein